jgi:hypothetical protein
MTGETAQCIPALKHGAVAATFVGFLPIAS